MVNCVLSTESTARFPRILAVCLMVGIIILPLHQSVAQDCSCGAPCYVLLDNDSLYGVEDFIACLTIEVGPNVVVEELADVTFNAGESITVNNDVLINENATVALEIDPLLFCDLTADFDEDQSDACLDCNDDDSSVFPGAEETCNGVDDDCDGEVDEGFNLSTDNNNCGACGAVCTGNNNTFCTYSCSAGTCGGYVTHEILYLACLLLGGPDGLCDCVVD